jgi:hypothetical protein
LHLDIDNLKSAALNVDLSPEARDAARDQLRTIAGRSHDPRAEDARLVLLELEPQTEQLSDSGPDPIISGFTNAFITMALCDEAQARAGYPPFDCRDKEVAFNSTPIIRLVWFLARHPCGLQRAKKREHRISPMLPV